MTPTERLTEAYYYFKSVKPKQIDMDCWYVECDCGTEACFLGHCAMAPKLVAEGLRLNFYESDSRRASPIFEDELSDKKAGIKFFGLTEKEANALFYMPNSLYPQYTKRRVLRMLRRLLKKRGVEVS